MEGRGVRSHRARGTWPPPVTAVNYLVGRPGALARCRALTSVSSGTPAAYSPSVRSPLCRGSQSAAHLTQGAAENPLLGPLRKHGRNPGPRGLVKSCTLSKLLRRLQHPCPRKPMHIGLHRRTQLHRTLLSVSYTAEIYQLWATISTCISTPFMRLPGEAVWAQSHTVWMLNNS